MRRSSVLWLVLAASAAFAKEKAKTAAEVSLEQYIQQATRHEEGIPSIATPGSLYQPGAQFADLARDLRAGQIDDIVTILVADRASALTKGNLQTQRKSSAKSSVTALLGPRSTSSRLPDLAAASGDQQLQGQGTTSRDSTVSTTLSARVVHVLPNGALVVEGLKTIAVNSEIQTVLVRGVIRPADIAPGNVVQSDRLANLEVRVNGKGVVGDSIRRPLFLYRLLLGLLPF